MRVEMCMITGGGCKWILSSRDVAQKGCRAPAVPTLLCRRCPPWGGDLACSWVPTKPAPAVTAEAKDTRTVDSTPVRRSLVFKTHRTHEDVPVSQACSVEVSSGSVILLFFIQMRKIIAKRLLESKLNLPHSYMTVEVEMDSLLDLRKKFNEKNGSKVSVNDFVIKAVASALRSVPEANA
eukprot:766454-Hanusia_phi.AAC.1